MSTIKLGKTADSRTRKKSNIVPPQNKTLLLQQFAKSVSLHPYSSQDFANYLLEKNFSTITASRYIKDAVKFIEWAKNENVETENVSYADVLHYIQLRRKTVKQRTISTIVNSIKHFYNYLNTIGQSIHNPTTQIKIKGIKRKILYHTLSKQELESLYNNFAPLQENNPNKNQNWFQTSVLSAKRNKMILGLMIYQGLNTTEIKNLTLNDIKLREGKIYVAGTRRSNERTLSLESHQILDMMEYTLQTRNQLQQLTKKESDKLFISTGSGEGFSNLMQILVSKLTQINSKITSAKQIRTSVITQWLKLYNLRQVQYMAGHRYVSSTESYLINDVEDLQNDILQYHPL